MTPSAEEHSRPSSTPVMVPPLRSLPIADTQTPQPHAILQLYKLFSYFKIISTGGYGDDWMFPLVSRYLAEAGSLEAKHSAVDSLHRQSSFVLEHPPEPSLPWRATSTTSISEKSISRARIAWGAEGSSDKFYLFQTKYGSLCSEDTNPKSGHMEVSSSLIHTLTSLWILERACRGAVSSLKVITPLYVCTGIEILNIIICVFRYHGETNFTILSSLN